MTSPSPAARTSAPRRPKHCLLRRRPRWGWTLLTATLATLVAAPGLLFAQGPTQSRQQSRLAPPPPADHPGHQVRPGQNMVANPNFEQTEGEDIPGWHFKLTDFTRKPGGPEGETYVCARTGYDFGRLRPWRGMFSPEDPSFYFSGEDASDWYVENHTFVRSGPGRAGKGLFFDITSRSVGETQGVRAFSALMPATRGHGYKFRIDVRTAGAAQARVFIDGFRYARNRYTDEQIKTHVKKTEVDVPVERVYRRDINVQNPRSWQRFETVVMAPRRYQFDFLTVTVFGYFSGEVWFDNVMLTPMTDREVEHWRAELNKDVREERFGY